MKKQHQFRQYNFSDAELYRRCKELIGFAVRDEAALLEYGYSPVRRQSFLDRCHQFAELPADDELLGDQMLMTEKKEAAAEALRVAIRSLMLRVAQAIAPTSGRYRKFGTTKLNDMSDPQLLFCGRRVARVAEMQLPFLDETGLKTFHIDEVRRCAATFEQALFIQQDKIADRDIAVEKRVDLGNILYRELIALADLGKDYWSTRNRTYYDQYAVYESNNEQKLARKARNTSPTTPPDLFAKPQ